MDQVFVLADDFVIAVEEPNSSYPPSLLIFSLDRHCSHQCQQNLDLSYCWTLVLGCLLINTRPRAQKHVPVVMVSFLFFFFLLLLGSLQNH